MLSPAAKCHGAARLSGDGVTLSFQSDIMQGLSFGWNISRQADTDSDGQQMHPYLYPASGARRPAYRRIAQASQGLVLDGSFNPHEE